MLNLEDIPSELRSQLDHGMERANELWPDDPSAARAVAEETWNLLPEPRLKVAAYPHALADTFARAALTAGDLDQAEHWLSVAKSVYTEPPATLVAAHDKVAGGILFERGDLDGAYAAWTRAMKTLKGATFTGLRSEYRRFFFDRKAGTPKVQ